jgi:hypothetical protein
MADHAWHGTPSNIAAAIHVYSPPGPLVLALGAPKRAPPFDTNGRHGIDELARRLSRKLKIAAIGKVGVCCLGSQGFPPYDSVLRSCFHCQQISTRKVS